MRSGTWIRVPNCTTCIQKQQSCKGHYEHLVRRYVDVDRTERLTEVYVQKTEHRICDGYCDLSPLSRPVHYDVFAMKL